MFHEKVAFDEKLSDLFRHTGSAIIRMYHDDASKTFSLINRAFAMPLRPALILYRHVWKIFELMGMLEEFYIVGLLILTWVVVLLSNGFCRSAL